MLTYADVVFMLTYADEVLVSVSIMRAAPLPELPPATMWGVPEAEPWGERKEIKTLKKKYF
jgi:hypothetical protein